jgi:uncharacterized membrane protein YfcA
MYSIGFDARSSIPLNLLTSLITLALSMAVRSRAIGIESLAPHLPEIVGLAVGGVASAFYGARLVSQFSDRRLVTLIALLLAGLGILMLAEAAFRSRARGSSRRTSRCVSRRGSASASASGS